MTDEKVTTWGIGGLAMSRRKPGPAELEAAYSKLVNANRAADLLLGIDHALERRLTQRIAILKVEAAAHGDSEQVQLCELALSRVGLPRSYQAHCRLYRRLALSIAEARAACVEVLAQIDDDGQLDLFAE